MLICSSFSRENGHLLLICSSLSTSQLFKKIPRHPSLPPEVNSRCLDGIFCGNKYRTSAGKLWSQDLKYLIVNNAAKKVVIYIFYHIPALGEQRSMSILQWSHQIGQAEQNNHHLANHFNLIRGQLYKIHQNAEKCLLHLKTKVHRTIFAGFCVGGTFPFGPHLAFCAEIVGISWLFQAWSIHHVWHLMAPRETAVSEVEGAWKICGIYIYTHVYII